MPNQVEQEQVAPCRVALTIAVTPDDYRKAEDAVFSQLARRTNVPGFRPGKAPRHLVKRYIDESRMRELAYERVVTDAFSSAVKNAGLPLFSGVEPEVELPESDAAPEEGFTFKAVVALQPHVHLGDLEGLAVRRVLTTASEEDVERELEQLRQQEASWQEVEEPAALGDRLRATAQVEVDGVPVPDLSFSEPTLFELGANLESFDAGLVGMRAGEEKRFEFPFPEELQDEELRGKTATAVVSALQVQRRVVPPLDEAFAARHGAEDLEQLRARMRAALQERMDSLAEQEVNDALLREVIRRSEIHYPQELVDQEVSAQMNRLLEMLRQRGFTLDDYLKANRTTLAQYQESLRKSAEESLAASLTLAELGRVHDLAVTPQELEGEIRRRAEAQQVKPAQLRRVLQDTGEIDQLRFSLYRAKVAAFLRARASISEAAG